MNETVNKFLVAGDKFIPEMHLTKLSALGKLGFTCSACGPSTNNKERILKLRHIQEIQDIFIQELDKN